MYLNFAVARDAFDEDDFKMGEFHEKWGGILRVDSHNRTRLGNCASLSVIASPPSASSIL